MFLESYRPIDRDQYMDAAEISRLIWGAGNFCYSDWEVLVFIANTGIRPRELRTITPRHLFPDHLVVRVQTAKQRKGKVKTRDIDITKPVMDMLLARIARKKIRPDQPIFRMGRSNVWKIFKRAARFAGLPDCYSPKSLRHSRAIYLLELGNDITYVQHQLGHSNPAITAIYLHVTERMRQKARAVMKTLG